MSIDLTAASKDELREYARNELGINLPSNATEETLRERILAHLNGPVGAKPTASPPKAKAAVINIHKTQGKLGRHDVFVSVNNRDYLIKRGVDVDVPVEVVHVLENAVEDVFEYDEQKKDIVRREAHAYPFTVVR